MHVQGREPVNSSLSLSFINKIIGWLSNLKIMNLKLIPSIKPALTLAQRSCLWLFVKMANHSTPPTFTNTRADRTRLVKKRVKRPGVIVCMEATGVYHFDLAVALHDSGLTTEALLLIAKHPKLERTLTLLISIKGIAQTSAISLMGELLLLPPDLTHREWVKFAGLDPKAFDAGKSVHKKSRISKAGNRNIRAALYMPALSAKQHDPQVRAYFQHLVANGKKPLQAVCAIMRKLIHTIHGMLKNNEPFDNTRFYKIPTTVV